MQRTLDSAYCYYHDKVQRGLIDTFFEFNSNGRLIEMEGRRVYPVWPLPPQGYVLLADEQQVAA